MIETLSVEGENHLVRLFLPEEIGFRKDDPHIRMKRKGSVVSFSISSESVKNISKAKSAINNATIIHDKVIAIP